MNRFLSFLFLILFLFPFLEKELHALEHVDEVHCAEHEKTHLHHKDHICSIGDFSFDTYADISFNSIADYVLVDRACNTFYQSVSLFSHLNLSDLRGPPALS